MNMMMMMLEALLSINEFHEHLRREEHTFIDGRERKYIRGES
jgi:hypothetical protein